MKAKSTLAAIISSTLTYLVLTPTSLADGLHRDTRSGTAPRVQIKSFMELDTNNDGMLSAEEIALGDRHAKFARIDLDRDQRVNREEHYRYYQR